MIEKHLCFTKPTHLLDSAAYKILINFEESRILKGLLHWLAVRNSFAELLGKPAADVIFINPTRFCSWLGSADGFPPLGLVTLKSALKTLTGKKIVRVVEVAGGMNITIDGATLMATCIMLGVRLEGIEQTTGHEWIDDLDPKLTQDELWNALPGASKGLPKVTLTDVVNKMKPINEWAQGYPFIRNAPDDVKEISFVLFQETGLEPTTKQWLAQVLLIKNAVNGNLDVLRRGLQAGVKARDKDHLTMGQPNSFLNFIQNAKALQFQSNGNDRSGINKNGVLVA